MKEETVEIMKAMLLNNGISMSHMLREEFEKDWNEKYLSIANKYCPDNHAFVYLYAAIIDTLPDHVDMIKDVLEAKDGKKP